MNRLPSCILLVVIICVCPVIAKGTTTHKLLSDLLNTPAPIPGFKTNKSAGNEIAFIPQKPPSEFSNDLELLNYWSNQERLYALVDRPSGEVQKKLLDAAIKYPETLPRVLPLLQNHDEALDKVKKIYEEELKTHRFRKYWQEAIHKWLVLYHPEHLDDLIKRTSAATDYDSWVEGEDELSVLTARYWETARPILEKHAHDGPPRVATVALSLLYQKYVSSSNTSEANLLQKRLQDKVTDEKEPGFSRNKAVDVLMSSNWSGRDEWFLSLFHDETITYVKDGYTVFQPLAGPVNDASDSWIPRIVKLLDHKDRTAHNNAVSILIGFHLKKARRDALEPLLPWLSDPQWSSAKGRLRLVQSLHLLGMKQTIPSLIEIVKTETGPIREYAAIELAEFKAIEAIPVIKKALDGKIDSSERRLLIDALIDLNGFTDQEVIGAVEAYAVGLDDSKPSGYLEEDNLDTKAYIGYRIDIKGLHPTDNLVGLLSKRIENLESEHPDIAINMKNIFLRWKSQVITNYLLERFTKGRIGVEEVVEILNRQAILREQSGDTLHRLAAGEGIQKGVAVALLADENLTLKILQGNDHFAQQALLACTRLLRQKLPLETVGSLMKHADPMVALAAARYLESEDSRLARDIFQKHSSKLIILGARHGFDPGHFTFAEFERWENVLLKEFSQDKGPDEIFALLSAGYWGSNGQRIIRIRNGEAFYTLNDPGDQRYFENKLSPKDFQRLNQFISEKNVDNLGPLNTDIFDGIQYEYVHLTRHSGRRVFMNNPGSGGSEGTTYDLLTRLFIEIGKSASLNVKYEVARKIANVQVLFHHSQEKVLAVCGEKDSLFTLLEKYEKLSWHRLQDSKILYERAEEPKLCRILNHLKDVPEDFKQGIQQAAFEWQIRSGNDTIRGTGPINRGLWRCREGKIPRKINEGWYGKVIVTPDGRWAVASRTAVDLHWAEPNPVVRIALQSNKEFSLDLPPADNFEPIAFIPSHEKVLLVRHADTESYSKREPVGPKQRVFYLLNAETGDIQLVTGEFTPWFHQTFRPLQATDLPNEVWGALPDYDKKLTTVGRYNTQSFEFFPEAEFPDIIFDSMNMWVDVKTKSILLSFRGDLLRLPFAPQKH